MKTADQIYAEYRILPALQLHQLRVAAVAKTICDHFQGSLDGKSVVIASLLHDMGNIIKSDLARFPEFLEPQGMDYWQKVKDEFVEKYGADEHEATRIIAAEVRIPQTALSYLSTIGFSNLKKVLDQPEFERKICSYSDMRVGPYGVLPLEERIEEARKRYAGKKHAITSESFETLAHAAKEIEEQLFARTYIAPADINDRTIEATIKDLRNFRIA